MTKHKNILGERPRKKNNKKIKASEAFTEFCKHDAKTINENINLLYEYLFWERFAMDKPKEKDLPPLLNIGLCEKPQPMSKVQAFIIIALTLLAFVGFFKVSQRAMDIHALNTCEQYGDCAEVIRDINAN